jgi:hypothetical protein
MRRGVSEHSAARLLFTVHRNAPTPERRQAPGPEHRRDRVGFAWRRNDSSRVAPTPRSISRGGRPKPKGACAQNEPTQNGQKRDLVAITVGSTFPAFTAFRHSQRCAVGTSANTCSMWAPQPAKVGLRHRSHVTRRHMAQPPSGLATTSKVGCAAIVFFTLQFSAARTMALRYFSGKSGGSTTSSFTWRGKWLSASYSTL